MVAGRRRRTLRLIGCCRIGRSRRIAVADRAAFVDRRGTRPWPGPRDGGRRCALQWWAALWPP